MQVGPLGPVDPAGCADKFAALGQLESVDVVELNEGAAPTVPPCRASLIIQGDRLQRRRVDKFVALGEHRPRGLLHPVAARHQLASAAEDQQGVGRRDQWQSKPFRAPGDDHLVDRLRHCDSRRRSPVIGAPLANRMHFSDIAVERDAPGVFPVINRTRQNQDDLVVSRRIGDGGSAPAGGGEATAVQRERRFSELANDLIDHHRRQARR